MFNIIKSILLLFLPYRFLSLIYRYYCLVILKYIHRVSTVGKDTIFLNGFTIWNGKNIKIGSSAYLDNSFLSAGENEGSITIEDNVFFGHRVMVLARIHDYSKKGKERVKTILEKPIHIKKGAWIASGAIILRGVTIGENAVVAAGSVVTKDVKNNSMVGGNPAKFIKIV